MAVEFQEEISW
jgi:hypothetical protein